MMTRWQTRPGAGLVSSRLGRRWSSSTRIAFALATSLPLLAASGAARAQAPSSAAADPKSRPELQARDSQFPSVQAVQLGGEWGRALERGVRRLAEDPYRSAAFLRADFTFETNRIFVNYSGDISGRFIEVASRLSPPGRMSPDTLPAVLADLPKRPRIFTLRPRTGFSIRRANRNTVSPAATPPVS